MSALFFYCFKLSVCLGVIYLLYYLALRKLTFYTWNRWFLLLGTGLSFFIPLINILPFLEGREAHNLGLINVIPTVNNFSGRVFVATNAPDTFANYTLRYFPIIFGFGIIILGGKLLLQFISFFRISRAATLLQHGAIKIYQVDKNIAPFSFGKAIFLNKNLLQPSELQEIIKHELVHIRQKHTIDVLWAECLILVNWFNPLVWLLRRAIRQNLEFIADNEVLKMPGLNKKYYQYLLLKVIGLPDFTIAHPFNISSLKTRIIMMNKMPSNKQELAKFLFILPVMGILLVACQEDLALTDTNKLKAETRIPPPPPAPPLPELPPPPPPEVLSFNFEALFKQNPNIKNIIPELQNNTISSMVVELKSGQIENYNFKNEIELAQFRQRYGEIPVQNSPPPPPAVLTADQLPEEYKLFYKRNPQVELLGWQGEHTMVIFLKSGAREEYDVKTTQGRAKAEKKYGKLPKNAF